MEEDLYIYQREVSTYRGRGIQTSRILDRCSYHRRKSESVDCVHRNKRFLSFFLMALIHSKTLPRFNSLILKSKPYSITLRASVLSLTTLPRSRKVPLQTIYHSNAYILSKEISLALATYIQNALKLARYISYLLN